MQSMFESERQKLVDQKTQVACQGIESERRIYDLHK